MVSMNTRGKSDREYREQHFKSECLIEYTINMVTVDKTDMLITPVLTHCCL